MKIPKIFVTGLIPEAGINLLIEKGFHVHSFEDDRSIPREQLLKKVQDVDGVISLLSDKIDKEVIDFAKNLKIVANYAVGYNNIDVEYAKLKQIYVTNTPDVLTAATADLTWALILSVSKRIVESDSFTRKGLFKGWGPLLFLGGDVTGKTLGIIGAGRIGQAVSRRAAGFEMKIVYCNPSAKLTFERETGAKRLSLSELLETSDFVSIHCPLNDSTYHLLNSANMQMMKKNAYLINTSRGPVVDEDALAKILLEGNLAGAGLDVYEHEPKINKDLYNLPNVILLPHIGSATIETRNEMSRITARNIISVLEGRRPINPVY